MPKVPSICTIAACLLITAGCGSSRKGALVGDEANWQGKVEVEAYLFDAKLRRDNKPTSVRLEFFHTDSVIAFAGRGYLGKGALKGRLTEDSLEVYFPTTDEFVKEAAADLMSSFDCAGDIGSFNLMALFNSLPGKGPQEAPVASYRTQIPVMPAIPSTISLFPVARGSSN